LSFLQKKRDGRPTFHGAIHLAKIIVGIISPYNQAPREEEQSFLLPYSKALADQALSGFERYRVNGMVNNTIKPVLMMVKERPRKSVTKP
jgi:hypothetical protein